MPVRLITTGNKDCPFFNTFLKRVSVDSIVLPGKLNGKDYEKKLLPLIKGALIVFDEKGKAYDSVKFSKLYQSIKENYHWSTWVCGPSHGFNPEFIKKRAMHKISLSPMTFPHELARILVVEQLYRAEQILSGHPYHKTYCELI